MSNRTVILHVIGTLSAKGGTPRKLLSLVENCSRESFLHVFLCFQKQPVTVIDSLVQHGAIVELAVRRRNYDLRLLFDILRIAKKHKVNIINTHFARADVFGAVAGLLLRIPVVKSVHGILWNEGGSSLTPYLDRLLAPFRYYTVCNSQASLEAEKRRSRAKRASVIHNGVVPRQCNRTENERLAFRETLGVPPGGFLVVHVGGLLEIRRQDLIVEALSAIVGRGVDAYCVIAGDGRQKRMLNERVTSLGLQSRVKMFDFVDDVGSLLAAADAYVNMTTAEGFGLAVVEAMFARLPVVLANGGSHPELIVDGESGILVPMGESQALANALSRLAADSSLRQRLGESAAERARRRFSISRFVADFETFYTKCLRAWEKRAWFDKLLGRIRDPLTT